jgi:Helix-turn-helix domain
MLPPSDKGFEPRLARALDHPVRARFMTLLAERETLSPLTAQPLLGLGDIPLGNLTYHVRVLDYFGLVEPAGELDPEQGLAFRATPEGEAAVIALGFPPKKESDN